MMTLICSECGTATGAYWTDIPENWVTWTQEFEACPCCDNQPEPIEHYFCCELHREKFKKGRE